MIKQELKSFGYALNGLLIACKEEKHLRFHFVIAVLAIVLSWLFNLSHAEWALVILSIGLVIVAEMANTAIERLVDLCQPDFLPLAGKIKDMAAGAVLVASIISLVVGGLVFIPKCI